MGDLSVAGQCRSTEKLRWYVLDEILFCDRTRRLGATTDVDRCRVAGLSRATLARWRRGTVAPSLLVLDRVCARLGVARHRLLYPVDRTPRAARPVTAAPDAQVGAR